VRTG